MVEWKVIRKYRPDYGCFCQTGKYICFRYKYFQDIKNTDHLCICMVDVCAPRSSNVPSGWMASDVKAISEGANRNIWLKVVRRAKIEFVGWTAKAKPVSSPLWVRTVDFGRNSVGSHKSLDIVDIKITLGRFTLHTVATHQKMKWVSTRDSQWGDSSRRSQVEGRNSVGNHKSFDIADIRIKPWRGLRFISLVKTCAMGTCRWNGWELGSRWKNKTN